MAAAVVENQIFFAGGDGGVTNGGRYRRVDIYDLNTDKWSTASLSEDKRDGAFVVGLNGKVYIAGGNGNGVQPLSNKIDVYDKNSNTWSISSLVEPKIFAAAIAAGNRIFWAGGYTNRNSGTTYKSCVVEVRDVSMGTSSVQYLSSPGAQTALLVNSRIVFCAGGNLDLFDPSTNSWTIGVLPVGVGSYSAVTLNNVLYTTSVVENGRMKVWRLDF